MPCRLSLAQSVPGYCCLCPAPVFSFVNWSESIVFYFRLNLYFLSYYDTRSISRFACTVTSASRLEKEISNLIEKRPIIQSTYMSRRLSQWQWISANLSRHHNDPAPRRGKHWLQRQSLTSFILQNTSCRHGIDESLASYRFPRLSPHLGNELGLGWLHNFLAIIDPQPIAYSMCIRIWGEAWNVESNEDVWFLVDTMKSSRDICSQPRQPSLRCP